MCLQTVVRRVLWYLMKQLPHLMSSAVRVCLICPPVCMSMSVGVYVCVCIYVCLCLWVCMSACLHVSTDSCKKSAVVFDEAIASFDVINCQSVQAQVCVSVSLHLGFYHQTV